MGECFAGRQQLGGKHAGEGVNWGEGWGDCNTGDMTQGPASSVLVSSRAGFHEIGYLLS